MPARLSARNREPAAAHALRLGKPPSPVITYVTCSRPSTSVYTLAWPIPMNGAGPAEEETEVQQRPESSVPWCDAEVASVTAPIEGSKCITRGLCLLCICSEGHVLQITPWIGRTLVLHAPGLKTSLDMPPRPTQALRPGLKVTVIHDTAPHFPLRFILLGADVPYHNSGIATPSNNPFLRDQSRLRG